MVQNFFTFSRKLLSKTKNDSQNTFQISPLLLFHRKMAKQSKSRDNILFYCYKEHIGNETESTERYMLMWQGYVPVHLFIESFNKGFLKNHYRVRVYPHRAAALAADWVPMEYIVTLENLSQTHSQVAQCIQSDADAATDAGAAAWCGYSLSVHLILQNVSFFSLSKIGESINLSLLLSLLLLFSCVGQMST